MIEMLAIVEMECNTNRNLPPAPTSHIRGLALPFPDHPILLTTPEYLARLCIKNEARQLNVTTAGMKIGPGKQMA